MRLLTIFIVLLSVFCLTPDLFAARVQVGSGGFVDNVQTVVEKDTAVARLHFTGLDPAFGPVTVKLRIWSGKNVQGFKVYRDSQLLATRHDHTGVTVEFVVSPDTPVTLLQVKANEVREPFKNYKKIYLSVRSLSQSTQMKGRKLKIKNGKFTMRLMNDYPYLTQPAIKACAIEDGYGLQEIDILRDAVLFNGAVDSSRLSIALTDSPFSDFGATLTIVDQKLYYDPSTWGSIMTDSWLAVGMMDSASVLLVQSDGGTACIPISICYGPKYYRNRRFDAPYGYINYYFKGAVDTSLKYPASPKYHAYILQNVIPDHDPWYNPWKKGQDNHLYRLGQLSEITDATRFSVHRHSGGKNKLTTVISTKATMRLYNPKKMKQLKTSGIYFLDSGVTDPTIHLPAIPMIMACHIKAFGKKNGKKVVYPGGVAIYCAPTIDSFVICSQQGRTDSVILLFGNGFSEQSKGELEYRPATTTTLGAVKLKRLRTTAKKPISLLGADGKTYAMPLLDDPFVMALQYPVRLPETISDPVLQRPRFDLLIRTKYVIGGVKDIIQ